MWIFVYSTTKYHCTVEASSIHWIGEKKTGRKRGQIMASSPILRRAEDVEQCFHFSSFSNDDAENEEPRCLPISWFCCSLAYLNIISKIKRWPMWNPWWPHLFVWIYLPPNCLSYQNMNGTMLSHIVWVRFIVHHCYLK